MSRPIGPRPPTVGAVGVLVTHYDGIDLNTCDRMELRRIISELLCELDRHHKDFLKIRNIVG